MSPSACSGHWTPRTATSTRPSDEGLRCVVSYDRSGFDEQAVGQASRRHDRTRRSSRTRHDRPGARRVEPGRPAAHRARARGLPRVRLQQRGLRAADRQRRAVRPHRHLRHPPARVFGVPQLPPQPGHEPCRRLRLDAALRAARAPDDRPAGDRRARRARRAGRRASDRCSTTIAARVRATIGAADCDVYALEGDELRCLASVDDAGPTRSRSGTSSASPTIPVIDMALRTREPHGRREPRRPSRHRRRARRLRGMGLQESRVDPPVVRRGGRRRRSTSSTPASATTASTSTSCAASARSSPARSGTPGCSRSSRRRNRELAELVDLGRRASAETAGTSAFFARSTERVTRRGGRRRLPGLRSRTASDLRCLFAWEDGERALGRRRPAPRPRARSRPPAARSTRRRILVVTGPDDAGLSECRATPLRGDRVAQRHPSSPSRRGARRRPARSLRPPRARLHRASSTSCARPARSSPAALDNARLVERLEHANAQLGHLVEAGLEFGSTLETEVVLRSVARRLCAAARASTLRHLRRSRATPCAASRASRTRTRTTPSWAPSTTSIDFDGVRDVIAQRTTVWWSTTC